MVLWSIRDSILHGKINAYTVALSTFIYIAKAYDLLIKGYGWFPLKAKAFALTSVRNKPRTYEPANATYSFLNRQVKFWVRRLNEYGAHFAVHAKKPGMVKHLKLRFSGEFSIEHKIRTQILPFFILILLLLMFSLKFVGNHKYPDIMIKIQISQPNALTKRQKTKEKKKFESPSAEYRCNLAWLYWQSLYYRTHWPSLHWRTHYSSGRTWVNIRYSSGYSSLV